MVDIACNSDIFYEMINKRKVYCIKRHLRVLLKAGLRSTPIASVIHHNVVALGRFAVKNERDSSLSNPRGGDKQKSEQKHRKIDHCDRAAQQR